MKERINQIFKVLFFLSLSGLLLYLAFRKVEFTKIADALRSANYSWLVLSFTFAILAFFSRARRWILMIRPLGFNPSLSNTYHAMMTGYLVNFGLPRMGEVSKCMALGKKENIPVDKLIGTMIVERTFDVISMFIIMIIMLILRGDLMGTFIMDNILSPLRLRIISVFGSSLKLLIFSAALFIGIAALVYLFRRILIKNSLLSKVVRFLKGVGEGLRSFYAMENKPEFIFHTLFLWINYIMMSWVVVFMIPATSNLTFADATFLVVIGSLGMSAPVQGGIGAFHWIVSRGLHFVYGITLEDGLVYATLAHESQAILVALLGTLSFYMLFRKKRSASNNRDEGQHNQTDNQNG